ncbi:ATP synthase mitochondrial F1 complex assembly factor 1 [Pseudolycoriella hygida]|uniref:ATP synthase mitochondrial F1 complex assembly factor 1 n=1 Tax=Pseudolycoriella hygida TaxID=35572 RepID=A0A9Q0RYY8_9DIPT|nr:ATP synthase mitochondrial F1 complex assembly factor 1 [Pseudolycoriella hygida]
MALALRKSLLSLNKFKFNRFITMSAQLRAEKALEELKNKNPYYEKYASKITTLQQTSPEEFLNRIDSVEKKNSKPKQESKPRDYSELLNPKPSTAPTSMTGETEKKLSDIMRVELLQDKSVDEIKHIWLEYHKQKEVLVATIPTAVYETQMKRGKEHPIFIFPLPRSEGFEFFLAQFALNTVHFTPLLCYQVHKENAPECLKMVHYTEFSDKGLVLMRGEFDTKVINPQEAQCLINQLQLYYSQDNASKLQLLEKFTKEPANFKHMDVIKELENISL